jgi:hypothetical protein
MMPSAWSCIPPHRNSQLIVKLKKNSVDIDLLKDLPCYSYKDNKKYQHSLGCELWGYRQPMTAVKFMRQGSLPQ